MTSQELDRQFPTEFARKEIDSERSTLMEHIAENTTTRLMLPDLEELNDGAKANVGRKQRFNRKDYYPPESKEPLKHLLITFFPHRTDSIYRRFDHMAEERGANSRNRIKPNWLTSRYPLSETEIVKAFAGVAKYLYGCKFGELSRFAVLDIDAKSQYHNVESINKIRNILGCAGLKKSIAYQSSDSTGWHLYLFFGSRIECRALHNTLFGLLAMNGYRIKSGTLEIFPNPGQGSGFGLRLPLQAGFAWLDQITMEVTCYSQDLLPWERCKQFIEDTKDCNSSNEWSQATGQVSEPSRLTNQAGPKTEFKLSKIETKETQTRGIRGQYNKRRVVVSILEQEATEVPNPEKTVKQIELKAEPANAQALAAQTVEAMSNVDDADLVNDIFGGRIPVGLMIARWIEGREFLISGLTHTGQRSHALWSLSHHLFYGDPSRQLTALGYGYENERAEELKDWLFRKHNGFSKQINDGDPDAYDQIDRMVNCVPPALRNVAPSEPAEAGLVEQPGPGRYSGSGWENANTRRSRQAIKKIFAAAQQLKEKPSLHQLSKLSGCAIETVRKYKELWEPLVGVEVSNVDHQQ